MTTLFGMPAPENLAEYCSLCNDCGDERFCPCETYYEADEETKKAMSEAIDEEVNIGKGSICKKLVEFEKANAELKQILYKLVNAFNNYECAGSEQEQENTWEILRDLMHEELFSIQNNLKKKVQNSKNR